MKSISFIQIQGDVCGANIWSLAKRAGATKEEVLAIKDELKILKKEFGEDYDGLFNTYGICYFHNNHQIPYCAESTFYTLLSNARDKIEAKRKAEEEFKKPMTLAEVFGDSDLVPLQAGCPIFVSHNGSDILLAVGETMSAPVYEDTAFKKGWFFPLKVPVSKTGRVVIINDVFCTQKMKDQITKGTEVLFGGYLKEDNGKIFAYCNIVRPTPLDTPLF